MDIRVDMSVDMHASVSPACLPPPLYLRKGKEGGGKRRSSILAILPQGDWVMATSILSVSSLEDGDMATSLPC